jgi:recombination protein RecA
VANNLIEKSGAWFSYKGNRIGQGKENARTYLREHPAIADEIESLIRTKLMDAKLPPVTGAVAEGE